MRVMTFLVVAALAGVGLAGCFGKSDSGTDTGGNTTTTTPGATPTTNSTGGGSTGGTNTTGGGTTLAPKELKKDTHDFANDAGLPPPAPVGGAPAPVKFTPDPGYTKLTYNVTLSIDQGLPAAPNNAVTVKIGSFTCAADNPMQTPTKVCPPMTVAAAPGQIEYSGNGPITAVVQIIES